MGCFGCVCEEVECEVWVLYVGYGVWFVCMYEVGEFDVVVNEEYWLVDVDYVLVVLLCIEFYCEVVWVVCLFG